MASSSGNRSQAKWAQLDVEELFSIESLQKHFKSLGDDCGYFFKRDRTPPESFKFPDFGAHELQSGAISNICVSLMENVSRSVISLTDMPSLLVSEAMGSVWCQVLGAVGNELLSSANMKRMRAQMEEEKKIESEEPPEEVKIVNLDEKQSPNNVLIETGVKSTLRIVFALLKQAWAQLAWQRQIEQAVTASGSLALFGGIQTNLPNEVLKSILDILDSIPPLALSNQKSLSKLSVSCLEESSHFLEWILQPDSQVDVNGKRLACEITLNLVLQHGSLVALLDWISKALMCLEGYATVSDEVPHPTLSLEFCQKTVDEIRKRTVISSKLLYTYTFMMGIVFPFVIRC